MLWALEGAFFNFSDLWGKVLELCAKASSLSIEATASKMERLLIQVVEWFWSIRRSVTARRRFSCSSQCSSLRTELWSRVKIISCVHPRAMDTCLVQGNASLKRTEIQFPGQAIIAWCSKWTLVVRQADWRPECPL